MRNHLNEHGTGFHPGAIPAAFLHAHNYSQCPECDRIVHNRFRGICPKCRPARRERERLETLRNRASATSASASSDGASNVVPGVDATGPSTPNVPPLANETLTDADSFPSLAIIHGRFIPTVRHVPKDLRRLWAQCLSRSVARAVWANDVRAWSELQMLPKCVLCTPPRGGKSHQNQRLAWTRGRLNRWLAGERSELWRDIPKYQRPAPKQLSDKVARRQKQERCIELCGEGGYGNACKSLVKPPPLGHTRDVFQHLKAKHPEARNPVDLSSFGSASRHLVPTIDAPRVESCIRSFHQLSGGGPSGLRPIHLKDCIETAHRDEILQHVTALVNLLAKGDAPNSLAPFLAGAGLTALPKKDDDIRPVAVGDTWRRLTAKTLCATYKDDACKFFYPLQIGVGLAMGTEVGVSVARQWCKRHASDPSAVFVLIDFANAFNCVDRDAFLSQCRHQFPGLSRWVEYCYSQPSHLYFGQKEISSQRGVQQGDPLGPLLFSLALQPLLQQLQARRSRTGLQLVFSYLDDLCLAGDQQTVSEAFHWLKEAARNIGLEFNTSKCEVVPAAGANSTLNQSLFPQDVIFRNEGNFKLLAGPIGSAGFCNTHTQKRANKACELLKALGELPDPQVALTLLRQCASFCKLVYSLRVVPHRAHKAALHSFDDAVRNCVDSCCSFSLSDDDWTLASLSTRHGGLGFRSTEHHSPAAFLSSQVACHEHCAKIDPDFVWDPDNTQSDAHAAGAEFNSRVVPADHLTDATQIPSQQKLSAALDTCTLFKLRLAHRTDVHYQAHLNHTSSAGASQWIHARPSKSLRSHVDPSLYRLMMQRHLRAPIFESEFHCPLCDDIIDRFGDHCLVCPCGGDKTKRHNLLRNEVFYFCGSANLNPELERPGLLQPRPLSGSTQENGAARDDSGNRRPADVYLPRWRRGGPAALDFAVTSGLRTDIVRRSAVDGSIAASAYEDTKRSHLDTAASCQAEGLTFIPVVCEADGGGWGPAAQKTFSELAKHKSALTGEDASKVAVQLYQSLGLVLQRENARAIIRRFPNNASQNDEALLAAAAAC